MLKNLGGGNLLKKSLPPGDQVGLQGRRWREVKLLKTSRKSDCIVLFEVRGALAAGKLNLSPELVFIPARGEEENLILFALLTAVGAPLTLTNFSKLIKYKNSSYCQLNWLYRFFQNQ